MRVASVPNDHIYVRHLSDPDRSDGVVRLGASGPARPVAGVHRSPTTMLNPEWIARNADAFDIYHLHFGFDALPLNGLVRTARLGLVSHQIVGGIADRIASSAFRWAYARVPLAPKAFREVARENGVRPLGTVVSLIEADHNLLTVMPWELEGYDLPASYQRVGPIFARLGGEVPDMVHELAAADRPLVYLALGSSGNRKLALRAARALGELPVNVVAPLRQYLRPSDAVPANVHVTDLLPADQLGGLVDAAVLHGGQGTVQTACATGVPFVGMGLSPEQAWNVEVSVAQGNAVGLRPGQVGSSLFRSAVRDVLMDSGVRAAADRVRRAYADEDGAAAAARAINEVLASSRGA